MKLGGRSYTVEEAALAVGEVIRHGSVESAIWTNVAVEQVHQLVEAGISVGVSFASCL